jgi:hypothetical protein
MWHGYFAIEDLNLNVSQRQTLVGELCGLGPGSDPQPARLCHWRTRLDNRAVIFEASFQEDNLTVAKFKNRLGTIFGVSPDTIDTVVSQTTFGSRPTPVVTFSRSGTDYIRMAAFGGVGASWSESGYEARAYLQANADAWEEPAV